MLTLLKHIELTLLEEGDIELEEIQLYLRLLWNN
jgi:hypothetical protein